MKNTALVFLTAAIIIFQLSTYILPSKSQITNQVNDEIPVICLEVNVLDVNLESKTANLKIFARTNNFPHNKSFIEIRIGVRGLIYINCSNTGPNREGFWSYQGESEETTWLLYGRGENFPFDSYLLCFEVLDVDFVQQNFTIQSETIEHQGVFTDSNTTYIMKDIWALENGFLPIEYVDSTNINFILQRNWDVSLTLFLQFMLPSILCYYLLGFSNILNPKRLGERLRIYLSIFFFVPTFLFVIQTFLPYRTSLSLPEFLLVNLIVSNTIFGICSIIGYEKSILPRYNLSFDEERNLFLTRKWDIMASILSLTVYSIMNLFVVSNKFLFGGLISLNVVVLSYIIPVFIANPTKRIRFLVYYFILPNVAMVIPSIISFIASL